ncbi:hypothetical protein Y032_0206g1990 [Ancylostoma ceylanicum]|uniref:G-protein coupled receptors family 1 profile domain-containing protein n=1 Tax=Ancylostoma ceylanicum TaxID=53326 RepID=A0A016SLB4_9BILA|nr:hypothetical protein Y032_0206g1990 [Ancylostoma ceylanicum]
MVLLLNLDSSPDIDNLTQHLNCSYEDSVIIFNYDSAKFRLIDFVIPVTTIVLSVIGLIINGVFIFLTITGIRDKGYSLLLNRSFTDVLTSVLTLVFVSLHRLDQVPDPKMYPEQYQNMTLEELDYLIPHGRSMFTLLLTLNFWASAGCYSVLALFMFLAVRHPIIYRVKITSKRTIIIGCVVWLVGLVYAIIAVCISSNNAFNIFNSRNDLIQWSVSSEDFALSISNLVIVIVALIIGISSYTFIIVYLWRARHTRGEVSQHLMSIVRMALNVFAFAISCVVMAGFVSIPLVLKGQIDDLNDDLIGNSTCETVVGAYELGYHMAQWTTAAMTGWQLRMIVDPLANLFLDTRFTGLSKQICCPQLPSFQPNFKVRSQENAMDFLRKCAEMNVMPVSVMSTALFALQAATTSGFDPQLSTPRLHHLPQLPRNNRDESIISVSINGCSSDQLLELLKISPVRKAQRYRHDLSKHPTHRKDHLLQKSRPKTRARVRH